MQAPATLSQRRPFQTDLGQHHGFQADCHKGLRRAESMMMSVPLFICCIYQQNDVHTSTLYSGGNYGQASVRRHYYMV